MHFFALSTGHGLAPRGKVKEEKRGGVGCSLVALSCCGRQHSSSTMLQSGYKAKGSRKLHQIPLHVYSPTVQTSSIFSQISSDYFTVQK